MHGIDRKQLVQATRMSEYKQEALKVFNHYEDGLLVAQYVGFNPTVGWLYRNQPFGAEPEHSRFDIEKGLRAGEYRVGNRVAHCGRAYLTLDAAREAAHCLEVAGHFE